MRFAGEIDGMASVFASVQSVADVSNAALMAEVHFHEASFELSVNSNYSASDALLQRVIESCGSTGSSELELLARSTLGQLHVLKGKAPLAVEELAVAAKGWRALGGCANVGWVLNNLGMAYILSGDFASAIPVLTDAIAEAAATGNARSQAYAIASLADAELAQGDWENAQTHYQEALTICTESAPDASLAILSVVGLSATALGLGDVEKADFYIERAAFIAKDGSAPFDLGSVLHQQSAVMTHAGEKASATTLAQQAKSVFERIESPPAARSASYRYALCLFNQNQKAAAAAELVELSEGIEAPWMTRVLAPQVAEAPMFAQWAAARPGLASVLGEFLSRESMRTPQSEDGLAPDTVAAHSIHAKSLGALSVRVGGEPVSNHAWESARAKELFFLLLNNPGGLRKSEAVVQLSPGLSPEKQNSTFHSNLYRVRKALSRKEAVQEVEGLYRLDPSAEIHWDVTEFERLIVSARKFEAGSQRRAKDFQRALEFYDGPFAVEFFNDWAAALRLRIERGKVAALTGVAAYLAAGEEFEQAIECMERVLQTDAVNEEAAYLLMTMKARSGQTVAALTFHDEFAQLVQEEVGAKLPERFSTLRAQIASGVAV